MVLDGSGTLRGGPGWVGGPSLWAWIGKGTLGEVRDDRGTFVKVRDGSGDALGGLG